MNDLPISQSDIDAEGLQIRREDVPKRMRSFFDAAPVLAVTGDQWRHTHSPVLGKVMQIAGVVSAGLVAVAVVVDQLGDNPFLDDVNKIIAGCAAVFVSWLLLGGIGALLSHGKIYHIPSGKKVKQYRERYQGSAKAAKSVLVALNEGSPTYREISRLCSSEPWEGDLFVITYTYKVVGEEYALATVYLRNDNEFTIWPPVEISPSIIPGLIRPSRGTHYY